MGEITYNTKRNLLGAISTCRKIAYHLFFVDANCSNIKESIKLVRKSKWYSQYVYRPSKFNIIII